MTNYDNGPSDIFYYDFYCNNYYNKVRIDYCLKCCNKTKCKYNCFTEKMIAQMKKDYNIHEGYMRNRIYHVISRIR